MQGGRQIRTIFDEKRYIGNVAVALNGSVIFTHVQIAETCDSWGR